MNWLTKGIFIFAMSSMLVSCGLTRDYGVTDESSTIAGKPVTDAQVSAMVADAVKGLPKNASKEEIAAAIVKNFPVDQFATKEQLTAMSEAMVRQGAGLLGMGQFADLIVAVMVGSLGGATVKKGKDAIGPLVLKGAKALGKRA